MVTDTVEEWEVAVTVVDSNVAHSLLDLVPLIEVVIYEVAENKSIYILINSALNTLVDSLLHVWNTLGNESLHMTVNLTLRVADNEKSKFILYSIHWSEGEVVTIDSL